MSNAKHTVAVGRPLLKLMKLCFQANRPVLLEGDTGAGKSEVLKLLAHELGVGYLCRDLSLMEPPDLTGLPQIKDNRTHFFPPGFLPTGGKGIFVLEEINRAPDHMRGPCLQLLTERCLNDYRLPEGWLPVAAINPADDGYHAEELDPALLARFVRIRVVPDRAEWLAWAREHGVHKDVLAYVAADPDPFGGRQSNPRAWTYASDILLAHDSLDGEPVTPSQLKVLVAGCVGPERATAFFAFLKDGVAPLSAEEVLNAYPAKAKQVKAWKSEGKLDLVDGTLRNVKTCLQSAHDFAQVKKDGRQWANLGKFLADLPGDLLKQAQQFFDENNYPMPTAPKKGGKAP